MLNINNTCAFEGRIVNDLKITKAGNGQNQYSKLSFRIAVKKVLTKAQREQKKNGQQIQDSDFIPFYAIGSTADYIAQYFQKGSPIKVISTYNSFTSTDQQGNTTYGHIFKAEEVGFTISNNSNTGNANNNGNYNNNGFNNNGYGNNSNNNSFNNNNGFNNNVFNDDIYPVDDGDMPF